MNAICRRFNNLVGARGVLSSVLHHCGAIYYESTPSKGGVASKPCWKRSADQRSALGALQAALGCNEMRSGTLSRIRASLPFASGAISLPVSLAMM